MKKLLVLLLCPVLLMAAQPQKPERRQLAEQQLRRIAATLRSNYAPLLWKQEHYGWDLDAELEAAISALHELPAYTPQEYHRLLRDFLASCRDYHVAVTFTDHGRAELPLSIRSSEGRYFIAWLDEDAVAAWRFPFCVGAEVVSFDGKPIQTVIDELGDAELPYTNTPETDQTSLESMLTCRSSRHAHRLPRGPVSIGIRDHADGKQRDAQLIWQRHEGKRAQAPSHTREKPDLPQLPLLERRVELPSLEREGDPFGEGSRRSWVPELGLKVWESDKTEKYHAYLYKNEQGRLIGYLRIPYFDKKDWKRFLEHIEYFQRVADALVIDQVNNPGGDPMVMYAIASVFAEDALQVPSDQHALDQPLLDWASWMLDASSSDWFPGYLEELLYPLPSDEQSPYFVTEWCRQLLDTHEAGDWLSPPTWFLAYEQIPAHPDVYFDKPVLVLINELDFSCADYFAAVMQDNDLATLFGQRTAGAGGGTQRRTCNLPLGVQAYSYTCLISKRPDGRPLENLGVHPDISYRPTIKDYRYGFCNYEEAVNKAVSKLLAKGANGAKPKEREPSE